MAANWKHDQIVVYKVGDKVWLSLKNITTDRPSKKLNQKYTKYMILEVCGLYTYQLNTLPGIYNVFPTRLLQPFKPPLSGQMVTKPQLVGLRVNRQTEYSMESIIGEKRGRGRGGSKRYLVKWVGFRKPTWEPWDFMKDLVVLNVWEK